MKCVLKYVMTKQQEIETLNAFIRTLPQDSYLRPWLEYALPDITQDIMNDIFPTAIPSEARKQAMQILMLAKNEAAELRSNAQRELEKANKQANETVESARSYGRRITAAAKDAVERLGSWEPKY